MPVILLAPVVESLSGVLFGHDILIEYVCHCRVTLVVTCPAIGLVENHSATVGPPSDSIHQDEDAC
jgi:hypothetical protein